MNSQNIIKLNTPSFTKLEDKIYILQPDTGYLCITSSADKSDPVTNFCEPDAPLVWCIIMIDERAPNELHGNFVVDELSELEMLDYLNQGWKLWN